MSEDHKDDDVIKFVLLISTIVLISILAWVFLHEQISSGVRWIRVGQIYIIQLFTDHLDVLQEQLINLRPAQVSVYYLIFTTKEVMAYLKLPVTCILGLYAVISFFLNYGSRLTRKFGLEELIAEHAKAFPVITPIVKFNPLKAGFRTMGQAVPSQMSPFAEALAPEEWVAYKAIPMPNNELDPITTRQCFLEQLGRRWRGPQKAPPYVQALFVAFAMKANGLRKESDTFLAELSKCWDPKRGMRLSREVRKTIRDHIDNPATGRVMAKIALQHAYTTTALLRLLNVAREQGGVLAPAQFLWLRAVDRNIWYPLNNLGRGAIHIEAAAGIAHYRAEKSANKPIPNPKVQPAIQGLTDYLKKNGYTGTNATRPIPPRDYRAETRGSGARAPG